MTYSDKIEAMHEVERSPIAGGLAPYERSDLTWLMRQHTQDKRNTERLEAYRLKCGVTDRQLADFRCNAWKL